VYYQPPFAPGQACTLVTRISSPGVEEAALGKIQYHPYASPEPDLRPEQQEMKKT